MERCDYSSVIAYDDDSEESGGNHNKSRDDHQQLFQHEFFHLAAVHEVSSLANNLVFSASSRITALYYYKFK